MDDSQLNEFKQQLMRYRQQLQQATVDSQGAADTVELDQTRQGRLSRMDALQGQAMSLAAKNRRAQEIKRIDAALQRIVNGEFGYCEMCDEEIPEARLHFNPTVTLCVSCAEKQE